MGFRIATNVQSLVAQRMLGQQRVAQNHEQEKLASGERIIRAGDDAAGLAISEKLKAEIRSTRQATRNTQDAISLVQVAEGGLNEVGNMLIRMRELSIQAATDTLSDGERKFIDLEVQALKRETDRIADSTKFNHVHVLQGTGDNLEFQVGTGPNPERDRVIYETAKFNSKADHLGISDVNTQSKSEAQANLEKLDSAINNVSGQRAEFGAIQNRLQATMNNLMISDENMAAANSRIRDTDVAQATAELTKSTILAQAGVATLAQANQNGLMALKLL